MVIRLCSRSTGIAFSGVSKFKGKYMSKFVENFHKDIDQDFTDGRLNAPATARNTEVIAEVLQTVMKFETGNVIEIGSGTGQHVIHFSRLFPNLTWWPSDPETDHIKSIESWRQYAKQDNIRPACRIDASADWNLGKETTPPSDNVICIFSANVVHIAPWEVAIGILSGAGKYLQKDGVLVLYGPYSRSGDLLSEGNIAFDKSLKSRNPDWGIRDLDDILKSAEKHNMSLHKVFDMPSNNSTIVLKKD